jgi:VWFA-related protein
MLLPQVQENLAFCRPRILNVPLHEIGDIAMYPVLAKASGVLICLSALVMNAAPPLAAQQASHEPPPVTIRVSTKLVLVDVVVTDKQGNPITGLKPENFTLQEKGKTQKITFFSFPHVQPDQPEPPQLGPGIYSNKPEYRSSGGPVTAILLDAANTPFKDQAYARAQMLRYVQEQLKGGQKIGVFTLTDSLSLLQDFTSDPKVLLAALEKYKPQEQQLQNSVPQPVTAIGPGLDRGALQEAVIQAQSNAQGFQNAQVGYAMDRRVETTLQGMRSLARILGGIPGRKELIWLTAAFPFDLIPENRNVSEAELLADLPNIDIRQKNVDTMAAGAYAATERTTHTQAIRDVAAQLANAQIAIYPIDVRGLASGMEFQREDAANRQRLSSSSAALVRMDDITASQQTMREMAAETGGRAYVNQNEIRAGVAMALGDNAASYTLGYYPEDKKWDGNYRSVKVKVDRQGSEARHRRGYFAIDPTQGKDRKSDQQLAEILRDRAPDTQVIFSAQIKPAENGKVKVLFLVDPNTISAQDASGGSKKLNFVLSANVLSPEGKVLDSRSTKIDQTFDAATYQKILQQGVLVPIELDAKSGKNELRLVVQDARTGFVGSLLASMP